MEERKENTMRNNNVIGVNGCGMFAIWVVLTLQSVPDAFNSLKECIGQSHAWGIIVHSVGFAGSIIFSLGLAKVLYNCWRKQIFIRQNVICLRIMSLTYILPLAIAAIVSVFADNWEGTQYGKFEVTIFFLLYLLSGIFAYGTRLKEDDELTV